MAKSIYGDKKLDRKLKELGGKAADRIAHAGVRKSVQVVAKAIKKDVPPRFKNARKGIGWKATKGHKASKYRKNTVKPQSKAGVGVGMKKAKRKKLAEEHKAKRIGNKRGAGIGAGNFHWWVIGTKNRVNRKGVNLGGTRAMMDGMAMKASMSARGAIKTAMAKEVSRQLLKEAAKI
jgi:hypothetical protein